MSGTINWLGAVYAGACLGGVVWATIAHLALSIADPGASVMLRWAIIAASCIGLLAVGSAIARWARGGALRTAGAAVAIAPLTGPAAILGFFGLSVIAGSRSTSRFLIACRRPTSQFCCWLGYLSGP